jgi:hypothetical protein
MADRAIVPVTVCVVRMDANYDHPDQNWLVTLVGPSPAAFGLTVGSFVGETDAVEYAEALAARNSWSIRCVARPRS